ncbi:MAG TPA: hypothetical protein VHP38_15570 [Ruminiclostridium sp.]|nr:hypothetical protein [Ruminiclostridium sp.]
MFKRKKDYEIVISTPDTDENKMRLRREIGKAYCDFVIEYLSNTGMDSKQAAEMYEKIINRMDNISDTSQFNK